MTLDPGHKKSVNLDTRQGQAPNQDFLFDRSKALLRHLKRFGWDLIGTFLILSGILTMLGISNLSKGSIINDWILLLRRSFGWGSYLLVLILILLGILVFRHSTGRRFPFSFSQVIGLELAFFSALSILSLVQDHSLDRAALGKDGGIIGWGLAEMIIPLAGKWVSFGFYLILFIFFLFLGIGLFKALARKLTIWSATVDQNRQYSKTGVAGRAGQLRNEDRKPENLHEISQSSWRDDRLPPINLLVGEHVEAPDQGRIKENARIIETKLSEFGIPAKVIGFRVGPTVTQYALEPGYTERQGADGEVFRQKVKVAQISALHRDLALALSASRLRIETPVPGRSYIGIEVPNVDSTFVRLRPILNSEEFKKARSPLAIGLGRNVSGDAVVVDFEKLPHVLIAGTTNSGKSVCVTALTMCLLMNNTPADLKLVMLDPKMVELVRFNGFPHLLGKVETEIVRMLAVLRWALTEMDSRYRMLAEAKARNLVTYNQKMVQKKKPTLPRIVIIIDELADLMMSAPEQTEHSLIRLAQMARATGIHLIVATQRPSTDVVTGLIKANFPARVSFAVASSVDSRVILDASGAENLLGRGDMLFLDPQKSGLQRLQGIIVSDNEIEKVLNHWQKITRSTGEGDAPWEGLVEERPGEETDRLIEEATEIVRSAGRASTSLLQRRLRIGYPRAARLIDELEELGVVGPSVGSGKDREVLPDDDEKDEVTESE